MRLAADSEAIHGRGAEVIAISTDDADHQAAMFARWPTPHIAYVSDPGGERYLQPLALYDPHERAGIARPAIVVIDPDGTEVFRHVGRDFADRTSDGAALAALAALALEPIEPPAGGPSTPPHGEVTRVFQPTSVVAYFRGNRYAAAAIASRIVDPTSRQVAIEHRDMCDATLDAWQRLTR